MAGTVKPVGSGDAFVSGERFDDVHRASGPAPRVATDLGAWPLIVFAQQAVCRGGA